MSISTTNNPSNLSSPFNFSSFVHPLRFNFFRFLRPDISGNSLIEMQSDMFNTCKFSNFPKPVTSINSMHLLSSNSSKFFKPDTSGNSSSDQQLEIISFCNDSNLLRSVTSTNPEQLLISSSSKFSRPDRSGNFPSDSQASISKYFNDFNFPSPVTSGNCIPLMYTCFRFWRRERSGNGSYGLRCSRRMGLVTLKTFRINTHDSSSMNSDDRTAKSNITPSSASRDSRPWMFFSLTQLLTSRCNKDRLNSPRP
ncbi:hypothetical protein LINPERHAP2_LOCUS6587 [Linum perenne]